MAIESKRETMIHALSPKSTHKDNPNCPMRLIQRPGSGQWVCLDCGCTIQNVGVDVIVHPPTVET